MNRERAISYLLLYEEMMLTLPQDMSPLIAGQYLVQLIEHVRNRVNAETFMLDFGAGRVFTEDEILYLGVILRFQRPENVNLNASIWEQYLVQVSPFLDGLTFFEIPDHLVPLFMYPTENSRNLFDQGRKWSPVATALLLTFAGLGDISRGMNATLNAPPAKPRVSYNDVRNATVWNEVGFPPNNGAIPGTTRIVTLPPGTVQHRFGAVGDNTVFTTAQGTTPATVSLPPNTNSNMQFKIVVNQPIPGVTQSTAAPWLGQPGGGVQFVFPKPLQWFESQGIISIIPIN